MASSARRWARREWRAFKRDMTPGKILMRFAFGHPHNHPSVAKLKKPTLVARIRRDRDSGDITATGVRRGPDSWTKGPKRRRTYRDGL